MESQRHFWQKDLTTEANAFIWPINKLLLFCYFCRFLGRSQRWPLFDKGYNMSQFVTSLRLSVSNVQSHATLSAHLAVGTCCSCGWKAMQVTGPRWPRKARSSLNSAKCVWNWSDNLRSSSIISLIFLLWYPPRKLTCPLKKEVF